MGQPESHSGDPLRKGALEIHMRLFSCVLFLWQCSQLCAWWREGRAGQPESQLWFSATGWDSSKQV